MEDTNNIVVFDDPTEVDAKDLLESTTTSNGEIDFEQFLNNSNSNKRKATKRKNLTAEQRKKRNKQVKLSRRRNRH